MENKYYLPATMSEAVETCYEPYHRDHSIPVNLRLLLHKHVPIEVIANKSKNEQDSPKTDKEKNPRTEWLRDIAAYYKADQDLVNAARDRWQRCIDSLGAVYISMTVDWRMVVGLGGNSVFETDMTLHPLYGLPIIPGSALKGLTRAWEATEKNDTTQVSGPGGRSITLAERIFGNTPKAEFQYEGSVIFFDAILMNGNFQLTLDIMNPHYWHYYTKKDAPPSNDQKPMPIPFLTVSRATFLCAIAQLFIIECKAGKDAKEAKTIFALDSVANAFGGGFVGKYLVTGLSEEEIKKLEYENFQDRLDVRRIKLITWDDLRDLDRIFRKEATNPDYTRI